MCTSCASDGCDAWLACEVSDGCDACQLQAQVDNRYALSRTQLLADLSAAPTHEELLQGPTHAPEATLKVKHVSRRSLPAATYEGHILTESEASCTEAERDTIYVDASTGMIVGGVLSREVQEKIGAVFNLDAIASGLPADKAAGCGSKLGKLDVKKLLWANPPAEKGGFGN